MFGGIYRHITAFSPTFTNRALGQFCKDCSCSVNVILLGIFTFSHSEFVRFENFKGRFQLRFKYAFTSEQYTKNVGSSM